MFITGQWDPEDAAAAATAAATTTKMKRNSRKTTDASTSTTATSQIGFLTLSLKPTRPVEDQFQDC